jgi:ParB-like chromosome segregation protein Spo0J
MTKNEQSSGTSRTSKRLSGMNLTDIVRGGKVPGVSLQEQPHEGEQTLYIEIDRLVPNPYQPRRNMEERALLELMYSIKRYGLWDPLPVRINPGDENQRQLVAGHRRAVGIRRLLVGDLGDEITEDRGELEEAELPEDFDPSAQNVSLSTLRKAIRKLLDEDSAIKGLIGNRVPVVVREYDDTQMMEIAWSENSRRAPLSPPEEGDLFLQRRKAGEGMTQKQLAAVLGVEVTYVKRREAAAKDPEDIQVVWAAGEQRGMRVVTYLRQLTLVEERIRIRDLFLSGQLNTDQVRDAVESVKTNSAMKASSVTQLSEGAREHLVTDPSASLSSTVASTSLPVLSPEVPSVSAFSGEKQNGLEQGGLPLDLTPIASVATPPIHSDSQFETATKSEQEDLGLVQSRSASIIEDTQAALEDRQRQVREAKLATALRNLLSYHKDMMKATGHFSPQEIETRGSIEKVIDDIRHVHEAQTQE